MDGSQVKISKDDEYTLWKITKACINPLEKVINSVTHWHRFTIVNGAAHPREDVLRAVIDAANPGDFIPVKYKVEGKDSYFLGRNCGVAIKSLCLAGLTFRLNNSKLSIELTLNYLSFEGEPLVIHKHIYQASSKRFNMSAKTLDLSSYHRDPAMADIFCPLSIPNTLKYVIMSAKHLPFEGIIRMVNLSQNGITSVEALHTLKILKNLMGLDLSNNQIEWDDFRKFPKHLCIKVLWLDGNPLCDSFTTPSDYVSSIKEIIPSLESLDGADIPSDGLPFAIRTFIVSPPRPKFADEFLNVFFNNFSRMTTRSELTAMYHEQAAFSLVRMPMSGTDNSKSRMPYMMCSRNLLALADCTKAFKNIYLGPDRIHKAFTVLPEMVFIPQSFTVDIPILEENFALIAVTGLFNEQGTTVMLKFSRVFTLNRNTNFQGDWRILNDMMTVGPPSAALLMQSSVYTHR